MHYNLPGGRLVKSENAAKPASQPSQYLLAKLSELDPVKRTLDYGCGKLRYYKHISDKTQLLTLVDSEVQLSRRQKLDGYQTTIRDIFLGSNRVSVFNPNEFSNSVDLYDRAFCINVLSAIPFIDDRKRLLAQIISKLEKTALCLFVVQYRNSDFTRMSRKLSAEPWCDGFVLRSLRGYSFYALISPLALTEMLEQAGFHVVEKKLNQGSVYLWARRKD